MEGILKGGETAAQPHIPASSHDGESAMKRAHARITRPWIREEGGLRSASWEEALERAAAGFQQAVSRGGGSRFGLFSCSKATNEVNYLAQKFARTVLHSNNID